MNHIYTIDIIVLRTIPYLFWHDFVDLAIEIPKQFRTEFLQGIYILNFTDGSFLPRDSTVANDDHSERHGVANCEHHAYACDDGNIETNI